MPASLRARTVCLTHPGKVRTANEDSHFANEEGGVWIVADGMGGHDDGQLASSLVVEAMRQAPLTGRFEDDVDTLAEALRQANAEIQRTAAAQDKRMGSTAVALYLADRQFACLWAGDSRIYLLRDGALHQLTRDHTQVQEMVDRGLLTPAEARHHPMSHVLSRAVGVQETLELDAISDEAAARDVFLLCSDGLTGLVSDDEIATTLSSLSVNAACNRLLQMVLDRGAPDNVTMVAVSCEEKTALVLPSLDAEVRS
jgi:serine/threonine protein phosphatase PrpC